MPIGVPNVSPNQLILGSQLASGAARSAPGQLVLGTNLGAQAGGLIVPEATAASQLAAARAAAAATGPGAGSIGQMLGKLGMGGAGGAAGAGGAGGGAGAAAAAAAGSSPGMALVPYTGAGMGNAATATAAAAGAAAPTAATAAAEAASGGRVAQMFGAGGRFAQGSIGRAGLYGAGGYIGGELARGVIGHQDGTTDDAVVDAIKGAGIGAAAGSLLPVVGTGVGALLGGAAGGLYGALKGGDSVATSTGREAKSQLKALNSTLEQFDASPDLREQAALQFALGLQSAKSPGDVTALAESINAQLGPAIIADRQQQGQERARAANVAAVMSFMGPMMQQQVDRADLYANQWSQAMTDSAQGISNPGLRNAYTAAAKQLPLDNATQAAYQAQQVMLAPSLYGYNTQQQSNGTAATDLMSMLNAQQVGAVDPVTGQPVAVG